MINTIFSFATAGILLGISAGLSPGPLLTLVLAQTIKHNWVEGIKVAISPLITDLPIICLSLWVFNQLSQFNMLLALISFLGGAYIVYLGIESFRVKGIEINRQVTKSESIKKGVIANFLNPSPYLFWVSVGTPIIFKAFRINLMTAALFLISFYVMLIGSKILVAILVDRIKAFLSQRIYLGIMRVIGIALILFSLVLFYDGLKYL